MAISANQLINTQTIKIEIKDNSQMENESHDIIYKKGSSILKQLFYYIEEEKFSKALNKYFLHYKFKNIQYYDFLNKMIEMSGDKYGVLKGLWYNWFQREGVNEISLEYEKDFTTKKVSKCIVKQKSCLDKSPYMITHFVDFLFVYDL